jgi:hypothetical protein
MMWPGYEDLKAVCFRERQQFAILLACEPKLRHRDTLMLAKV